VWRTASTWRRTRTYSSTNASVAPLEVIQFPGSSASDGETDWSVSATLSVDGHAAYLQADPADEPAARSLTWSNGGSVFVLTSLRQQAVQQPLSGAQLLSVAQGVEIVASPVG
jgi:hypothetical protein